MRVPIQSRETGVALVMVLWIASLLSVIAAAFLLTVRLETRSTAATIARARADALADAGIQLAILELLKPASAGHRPVDGVPHELAFAGSTIQVAVEAESGKINLNLAPDELIQGLLESLHVEGSQALADAVLDWRDSDHDRRAHGAEDSDYSSAGLPYGARDGAFLAEGELGQVLGFTLDLQERLRPLVTVHSRITQVDPDAASGAVLLAVPGMDARRVQDLLAARESARAGERSPLRQFPAGTGRFFSTANPNVYTVRASTRLQDGYAHRAAVVRLTGNRRHPFEIIAWSRTSEPDALSPQSGLEPGSWQERY